MLFVATDIVKAMIHMHQNGVLHSDLKVRQPGRAVALCHAPVLGFGGVRAVTWTTCFIPCVSQSYLMLLLWLELTV